MGNAKDAFQKITDKISGELDKPLTTGSFILYSGLFFIASVIAKKVKNYLED